ncbi:hypothetical protein FACS189487_00330 [Campylobacterota bacterium]|nr:hypothetical protein FACS189487_00330 [Campylobacterota bacterium]
MEFNAQTLAEQYGVEYIYHITHISNLPSIAEHGLLSHNNPYCQVDISNQTVNGRRNTIEPIYRRKIHDYVPFYFSPKNPMLFVRRNIEDELVILMFSCDLLFNDGMVFTDGNAACDNTYFSNDLNELDMIDWEVIKARYWHYYSDGKRKKMAEVLVPNCVALNALVGACTYDMQSGLRVEEILGKCCTVYVDTGKTLFF